MARDLEYTSVPEWAVAPTVPPPPASMRTCTVIDLDAAEVAARWSHELAASGTPFTVLQLHSGSEHAEQTLLRGRFAAAVAEARVGWRVLVAGALADVLQIRAWALDLGVLDDEIAVATTDVSVLPVLCAHCSAATREKAAIDDVIECTGCGEPLLIHPHVSRRKGCFLGFKADAEAWESVTAAEER